MPDFFQRLAGRIAYFRAWRKTPEGKVFLEQNAIDIAVCAVLGFIFSAVLTSFVFGMLQAVRLLPPTSTIPTIVFVPLAIWGGIESVLIHFGWLGRKLRPRFWIWWAITLCIIGGAVAILAGPTLTDFERLRQAMDASDALQALPATQAKAARISALIEIIKTLLFGLYLNALAFAACGVLLWRPMPAAWTPFKNFQLFLLALATLAGRHAAGLLYASLATSEDPSLEFDIVRIFLAPIVMPLFGAMILLAIALIVGTCVMILVYIFVTVPLMIFDFLEKWANNAHIRAKKKQGLYEYLFRFDFWLRHDDPPFQPDESKGARFAEKEEIEHERELDGFAFGHNDGWPLFLSTENTSC